MLTNNDEQQEDLREVEGLNSGSEKNSKSFISDKKPKKDKKDKKDKEIEALKKEKIDLENSLKRALADYQNLLKNTAQEKSDFLKYSLSNFFLEILPIYQNLKTAINSLSPSEKDSPWVEGVQYVIKQFQDVFKDNDLEEIKTVGEKFDYNLMEALEGDGDIVKKEVSPGYKFKDKVILPAKVILNKNEESEKSDV